jgi:Esterase/lipase
MSFTSLLAKILYARSDAKRDKGLCIPEDIKRCDDISYGKYGVQNLLDVYCKGNVGVKQPVIISVHGGGFVYGSKKAYQFYCMSLAERGFAVVNFNYRLAPKYKFPAPVYDVNAAMEWVCKNADRYHLDTNNVFLVGDSAGAFIANQYATICANPAYAKLFDLAVPNFKLRAVGLNCGSYSLDNNAQVKGTLLDFFGKNPVEKYGEQLRTLNYIDSNYPPAFVMSSVKDFLKKDAEPMAQMLQSRGVEAICKIYCDEKESIGHVFHLNQNLAVACQCNDDQTCFFKEHVR